MSAVGAADTCEAVVKVAALEELVDGLVEDRPPMAELAGVALGVDGTEDVEVVADEVVEFRFAGLPRAVDADGIVEKAGQVGPPSARRVRLLASELGICYVYANGVDLTCKQGLFAI